MGRSAGYEMLRLDWVWLTWTGDQHRAEATPWSASLFLLLPFLGPSIVTDLNTSGRQPSWYSVCLAWAESCGQS